MADDFDASWTRLNEVLEKRIAVLGVGHPETLSTMASIAELLRRYRKPEEAQKWDQRIEGLRAVAAINADPDAFRASFDEFLQVAAAILDATTSGDRTSLSRSVKDLSRLMRESHLLPLVWLHDEDAGGLAEHRAMVIQMLAAIGGGTGAA